MSPPACRRRAALLVAAAIGFTAPVPVAIAGDVENPAATAASPAAGGDAAAALAAFDRATAATWATLPLQFRVIAFADSVAGYGNVVPRPRAAFAPSDTLRLYFEPVGYTILPAGDGFKAALAVDVEIRSPGGLVLASAKDFAHLEWTGRNPMHEVYATLTLALPPNLRPGQYHLALTLRDEASANTSAAALPFAIVD